MFRVDLKILSVQSFRGDSVSTGLNVKSLVGEIALKSGPSDRCKYSRRVCLIVQSDLSLPV